MRTLARKVITVQYTLARTSLAALDSQASRRLPDGGRISTALRRGLAALDSIETRVLGGVSDEASQDQEPDHANTKSAHGNEPIVEAQEGATEPDEARDDVSDGGTSERSRKRSRRLPTERDRAAQALLEEEQTQQHVGELAEADSDEKVRQAELRAKHQVAEQAEGDRAKARQKAAQQSESGRP